MFGTLIVRMALAMLLLMGAACVHQENDSWCGGVLYKIENEDEMSVQVGVDGCFGIEVVSNRTTGFSWKVILPETKALKIVREEFLPPPMNGMAGAAGKMHWCFRALKRGEWKIEFVYIRPWEKDQPPARRVILTVKVE